MVKLTVLNNPPPLKTTLPSTGLGYITSCCSLTPKIAPKIENQHVAANVDIVADRHK